MRLVDLIEKVEIEKLKKRMLVLYYSNEDEGHNFENEFSGYLSVLEELSKLTPKDTTMLLVVSEVQDDFDGKTYTDVSGNEEEHGELQRFALGFTSWDEWLDMEIDKSSVENYLAADLLAHILWEMTFFGYTNEEVQEVICGIEKSVDEIRSGEADLELVDLDEMFPDEME